MGAGGEGGRGEPEKQAGTGLHRPSLTCERFCFYPKSNGMPFHALCRGETIEDLHFEEIPRLQCGGQVRGDTEAGRLVAVG